MEDTSQALDHRALLHELGEATIAVERAERELEVVYAQLYTEAYQGEPSDRREQVVLLDASYVRAQAVQQQASARRTRAQTAVKSWEGDLAAADYDHRVRVLRLLEQRPSGLVDLDQIKREALTMLEDARQFLQAQRGRSASALS